LTGPPADLLQTDSVVAVEANLETAPDALAEPMVQPWATLNAEADDRVQLPFISARSGIPGPDSAFLNSLALVRRIAPSDGATHFPCLAGAAR
jgi:hypothetical protein